MPTVASCPDGQVMSLAQLLGDFGTGSQISPATGCRGAGTVGADSGEVAYLAYIVLRHRRV